MSELKSVKVVRRWGSHQPGETVEVDKTTAEWLVGVRFAEDLHNPGTSRHRPLHESGNGWDQSAGGDPTRRRPTGTHKGPRDGERAVGVQGRPKTVGDVSHVRPENLGREHKGNPNDVLLASGKRLSEDLAEQQREAEKRDQERASRASGQQGEAGTASGENAPQASGEQSRGATVQAGQPKAQG